MIKPQSVQKQSHLHVENRRIVLTSLDEVSTLVMYDIHGRRKFQRVVSSKEVIHLDDFAAGVYFLQLNNQRESITQKISIR